MKGEKAAAAGTNEGEVTQLAALRAEQRRSLQRIEALEQEVAARAAEAAEAKAQLFAREGDLRGVLGRVAYQDRVIRALYDSLSWRVTLPLRMLYGWLLCCLPNRSQSDSGKGLEQPLRHFTLPDPGSYPLPLPFQRQLPANPESVRLIAFLLPQFHPIPENDRWWGEGFTEWTSVIPARPQFEGHYQPHLPHDDHCYDLRSVAEQARQIELASSYGLHGFCYYFYWFSGKRLLERPLLNLLEHPELDYPFCLCWANENWSRRWDGLDQDVLIAQHYSPDDDIDFIAYVARYMRDKRYIRVDGKPLLLIYRPNLFPDMGATLLRWREWCREQGLGEIYLVTTHAFEPVPPARDGFDAAVEFPPNNSAPARVSVRRNPGFEGPVYDMESLVKRSERYRRPDYPLFRGVAPSWDNTARRKGQATIFVNSAPERYRAWLSNAVQDTIDRFDYVDQRLIFINAWNEWAEGAHLEPDQRYGHAWLQATRDALLHTPLPRVRIAVVIHLYYLDLFDEIAGYVDHLPGDADLLVSTSELQADEVGVRLQQRFPERNVTVRPVCNRGRDIAPFVTAFSEQIPRYDLVCKIHSKKSAHAGGINQWRQHLCRRLLGSRKTVATIIAEFQADPLLGLLYPRPIETIRPFMDWGGNREQVEALLERLEIPMPETQVPIFPAGSMFWFRPAALRPLLQLGLQATVFPEESGQLDGTLQHAIERSLVYIAEAGGYHANEL